MFCVAINNDNEKLNIKINEFVNKRNDSKY